jgi:glycine dehydrogenase
MSDTPYSLDTLEMHGDFIRRHIGPDRDQIAEMVRYLGLGSLEQIIDRALPDNILTKEPLRMTETISERAVIHDLRQLSLHNQVFISMIGMGYYGTIMPAVIKRNVLENPGWYTSYTPYQAEVSQGRLEALLNFQQMITDLTGMDIANASLLDEATAAAEAMSMCKRLLKRSSDKYFVDKDCHPQTIAVVETRAKYFGFEIIVGDPLSELRDHDVFGVLVQYPGTSGEIRDIGKVIKQAHEQSALVTVAADIMGLVLLKSPGELDADIVVGSAQRFGLPMGYGGPHAGYFATREEFIRAMPGRIIGVSIDHHGDIALRMALQTREQHIRREKATSNICTSQVLLAVIASFYAIYHGAGGLKLIASRIHRYTQILAAGLRQNGYQVMNDAFFDTLTVHVPGKARRIAARARNSRINLREFDGDYLGISLDETTTEKELITVWGVFVSDKAVSLDIEGLHEQLDECIPQDLRRSSAFLTDPVFKLYHSETEMMRYMRWLARRDIALDRSMIPLGSCTMKLSAATEMQALSQREFSHMHPFAPLDQAQGYQQLFEELEDMLCDLTGMDAFSLQPTSGALGEYTGLLVIRKYHEVRGEGHRHICLIPDSAHGTNPASAVMAGLQVVVVECDDGGNIDVADLRAKAEQYRAELAAIMVTYPSTHGVFEEAFVDICAIVHEYGGQVYLDGANLNALVGLSHPGNIGADVMHINLHKTFASPHGGGGPGMGPIGVKAHLASYLPDHPVVHEVNPAKTENGTIGTVSAAPWGSASLLTISWAYIAMMGAQGLRRATLVAILNANYIAKRLAPHYPVLYTGKNGMVAHECIIDLRPLKETCNVTAGDIAKRLIDYGFHAPTTSFPVPGTFMIEPTESENKREVDRFCEAMIAIRKEIAAIETGTADAADNLLHNAPHTHRLLLDENWDHPYSKRDAFYPMATIRDDKYWPPVGRIDDVYGDKHLVCSRTPLAEGEA